MNRIAAGVVIACVVCGGTPACNRRSDSALPVIGTPEPDINAHASTSAASREPIAPADWARADQQTVRLSPDQFPNLPSAVAARLRGLGCTVPQASGEPKPHNVITGRFFSSVSSDWAVLCSRNRASSILVFPGGVADSMVELESSPDVDWLQRAGEGRIEFSRGIAVAEPQYIVSHYEAHGGPQPPPLDHDGINDIFLGKGSTVLYWYEGRWLHLQGAD